MRQLMLDGPDACSWRDAPDPTIAGTGPGVGAPAGGRVLRPRRVRCRRVGCRWRRPRASGTRAWPRWSTVGDDVTSVRVGDRVIVPFQINCGTCTACRRGVTGFVRVTAADGDVRHGADRRPRRRRLHGRPGVWCRTPTRCWCRCPTASTRWPSPRCRTTSPTAGARSGRIGARLAALDAGDRRVLVIGQAVDRALRGGLRVGARRARRLRRHRPGAPGRRREAGRGRPRPAQARQVLGSVPGHRAHHGRPRAAVGDAARHVAGRRVHRHRHLPPAGRAARCWRCTPGACGSSPAGSTRGR